MAESSDFLCSLCGEFIAHDRDNPLIVTIIPSQPGDRVGTPVDMTKIHPFLAMIAAMAIPRLQACDLCLFTGTPSGRDANGLVSRNGIPVFSVNLLTLKSYFEFHNSSYDVPGLPFDKVELVRQLGPDSLIAWEPRNRAVALRLWGADAEPQSNEERALHPPGNPNAPSTSNPV